MTLGKVVPSCSNAGGNTKSPAKKTISPAKRWCFTLNNYTEKEVCSMKTNIERYCSKGGFGYEIGEQGTKHLQGYINLKTKSRPLNKKFTWSKRCHWEKCKGTELDNIEYIKKDGNWWWFPQPYTIEIPEFYDWEKTLKKELLEEPDDRKIVWIWEEKGCAGKTTFQKWLYVNYKDVVVLGGSKCDMKNGIINYQEKNNKLPKIVLVNIPRINKHHVSIAGLEEIKDMFFFSGKYEGGMVCGAPPHLIIFANTEPEEEDLSPDRWDIRYIG